MPGVLRQPVALGRMAPAHGEQDRQKLVAHIQLWRSSGRDAWVSRGPSPEGDVVISDACPTRLTR